MLRSTDRFVDLDGIREHLKPFNSAIDRPSVDPGRLIRMLLIGYCRGIRSERRLRLRGPDGAKDEFDLAAAAQNLRKLNN